MKIAKKIPVPDMDLSCVLTHPSSSDSSGHEGHPLHLEYNNYNNVKYQQYPRCVLMSKMDTRTVEYTYIVFKEYVSLIIELYKNYVSVSCVRIGF